jgi:predicted O-linked N-acetylglucosamine transferase (SPINDLY family)
MKPVWGLINHHDRERFQLHLLNDGNAESTFLGYRPDPLDQIHDVGAMNDQQLAGLLRDLQIDILIDLSAYSYPSRLSFFLQRIAPVTAAWFNMYATSGLPGYDYLVGDIHVVQPEEEQYYCERIERLPVSYLTFQVDYPVPPVRDMPCLRQGTFTFGSLVSQYKITAPVLDAWAAILRHCDDAKLLLGNADLKSPHNRDYLRGEFIRRGVGSDRVEFLPPADHMAFLGYYDRIDIALDSFPYNGGTTTMEALWQGVPVLTKRGDRWCGRTSQTLLLESHLADYVVADTSAYVERAVHLGSDRSGWASLADQRLAMRQILGNSSACDSLRLATEMEEMYERWTGR